MNKNLNSLHIVKLAGGLGNQMFQYAFAKALKYKNNWDVKFDNISYFNDKRFVNNKNKRLRNYELGCFDVKCDFATEEEIKYCKRKNIINYYLYKLYCKFFNLYSKYDENLFKNKPYTYHDGYFQNEKYFCDIYDIIKKDFSLVPLKSNDTYNKLLLEKINKSVNSVCIHVRRDEYCNLGWALTLKYYQRAVQYILKNIKNPTFFVFCSEDVNYIKTKFNIGYKFELIGEKNNTRESYYENMRLMMSCKHIIVANSSYSWWAAYLNGNKNKIVVAPSPWLYNKDDIICKNWVKINV